MIIGVLMVIGGGWFAFNAMEEMPPIFTLQGAMLGVMVASLGIVVIALGRINESISEQTDYFEDKFEKKVIRNKDGFEKLD